MGEPVVPPGGLDVEQGGVAISEAAYENGFKHGFLQNIGAE
jgi:hypothetical protein